jgi:O-antigen ligase
MFIEKPQRYPISHASSQTNYLSLILAYVFLLVTILLLSGAGLWPQDVAEMDNNFYMAVLKAFTYVIFIIQAIHGLTLVSRTEIVVKGIFVFQALIVIASIIQHDELFYASQYFIRLIGLTFGLLATSRTLGMERTISMIIRGLLMLLILSVIVAIFLPEYGRHIEGPDDVFGLWRGIFSHKNQLGGQASLLILICISMHTFYKSYVNLFSIAISVLCLVFTRSITSVAVSVLAVVAILGLRWSQVMRVPSSLIAIIFILIGFVLIIWLEDFAQIIAINIFDKDSSFTGRTDIWMYSWMIGEQAPFLGNGPGYLDANLTIRDWLASVTFVKDLRSAHNAFITTFIETGYLGLVAYFVPYGACLLSWFRRPYTGSQLDYLIIAAPISMLVYNFFESAYVMYNGLGTVLLNLLLIDRFSRQRHSKSHALRSAQGIYRSAIV